jgi:hypothetical protein
VLGIQILVSVAYITWRTSAAKNKLIKDTGIQLRYGARLANLIKPVLATAVFLS